MQQSLTAVLERNTLMTGDFETEPYETAWAREARWFIRGLGRTSGDDVRMRVTTQISPDGLNWCSLDDAEHTVTADGLVSWAVQEFGGWLRLKGTVTDFGESDEPGMKVLVYLALKG